MLRLDCGGTGSANFLEQLGNLRAPRMEKDIELTDLLNTEDNQELFENGPSLHHGKVPLETVFFARRLLYVSHFFAQFAEIAWQFCLTLFLSACTHYQSLILVSTYGLSLGLAVCFGGSKIGRFIDQTDRLYAARVFIWSGNLSVVAATAFSFILLSQSDELGPTEQINQDESLENSSWLKRRFNGVPLNWYSVLALIGIHVFGSAAQVLAQGFLVAVERDWVVVLSRSAAESLSANEPNRDDVGHSFSIWLSDTNVAMKQIDLGCKVAAPAAAGLLIPFFSGEATPSPHALRWVCILIGIFNTAALVVEYVCTARIHQLLPALANKEAGLENAWQNDSCIGMESRMENKSMQRSPSALRRLSSELGIYFEERPVCWAGVGLALLYLNALTFGNGIMTAYLLYRGMDLSSVGALRGVASAIGLCGTFVYHLSASRLSLEATGMWSISYQLTCLVLCILSLLTSVKRWAFILLVGGVCLSRIGLWVFDIAVTQMQQEQVPNDRRGVVGGVQQSLNAGFGLLIFVLGFFFPHPRDFFVFVSTGFASVALAELLFALAVYRVNE